VKQKRAWVEPNPKHPRGKGGRFVKRGTGLASKAVEAARKVAKKGRSLDSVRVSGPATLPKKAALAGLSGTKAPAPAPKSERSRTASFRGGTFAAALNGGLSERDRADVEAFMRENTEFTHAGSGMRATVTGVQRLGYLNANAPASFDVRYEIRDRDGKVVGRAWRQWSPVQAGLGGEREATHVSHMEMHLNPSVQGNGFARAWNERMEATYRASGVEEIRLTANEDVGGYAWAKHGYGWADDAGETVRDMAQRLENATRNGDPMWTPETIAEMRRLAKLLKGRDPSKVPTPLELSMVGWTPGAKIWVGKAFMLANAWEGVKKL
jgi:hypothetical protein